MGLASSRRGTRRKHRGDRGHDIAAMERIAGPGLRPPDEFAAFPGPRRCQAQVIRPLSGQTIRLCQFARQNPPIGADARIDNGQMDGPGSEPVDGSFKGDRSAKKSPAGHCA